MTRWLVAHCCVCSGPSSLLFFCAATFVIVFGGGGGDGSNWGVRGHCGDDLFSVVVSSPPTKSVVEEAGEITAGFLLGYRYVGIYIG